MKIFLILRTCLILILITVPTLIPFFNQQFFYTQDHIFVARLQQMSTALNDGHFPVRWAPDLRFGEPIFNFYASLPFYLGAATALLGFNFIWSAKILFILATIASAITMFIFCRKLFGQKAAYLGVVLYTYAPYRAVDLYVRGAISEVWAFVFFPLIFYASVLLSEKVNFKNISFLSFCLAGLFLTHNVTTLMFMPFLFFWWIYLATQRRGKIGGTEVSASQLILRFLSAGVLAIGIAGFFLFPALFERQFIQTKYLIVGYFDFRAHFVAFYQFFSTFWGYGASLWGPKDDISFQVGLVHWATVFLAVILGIASRKNKKFLALMAFLGFSFFMSIFLQHNKSAFLWEAFPLAAFIQFPWRFLAISIFIVSTVGALITNYLSGKLKILYYILILAAVILNIQYFNPSRFVDDSFFDKFLNVESMHNGVDLTKDYLPIWVKNDRVEYFGSPRAKVGEIEVFDFEIKTARAYGAINVLSQAQIEMPITYFPGWEVRANGRLVNLSQPSIQGLITFELPKGEYQINLALKDTPVRMIGNFTSLASLLITIFLWYFLASRSKKLL